MYLNLYLHFFALVSRTSAALSPATQHALPTESGVRSVLTLGSLCLPCNMRDTAWSCHSKEVKICIFKKKNHYCDEGNPPLYCKRSITLRSIHTLIELHIFSYKRLFLYKIQASVFYEYVLTVVRVNLIFIYSRTVIAFNRFIFCGFFKFSTGIYACGGGA